MRENLKLLTALYERREAIAWHVWEIMALWTVTPTVRLKMQYYEYRVQL